MQPDVTIFTSTWETAKERKKLTNSVTKPIERKKKQYVTYYMNQSDNVTLPPSIRVECQSIDRSKVTFHTTNLLLQNLIYIVYIPNRVILHLFYVPGCNFQAKASYYNTNLVIKLSLEVPSTMISGRNSWCILTTSNHNLKERRNITYHKDNIDF